MRRFMEAEGISSTGDDYVTMCSLVGTERRCSGRRRRRLTACSFRSRHSVATRKRRRGRERMLQAKSFPPPTQAKPLATASPQVARGQPLRWHFYFPASSTMPSPASPWSSRHRTALLSQSAQERPAGTLLERAGARAKARFRLARRLGKMMWPRAPGEARPARARRHSSRQAPRRIARAGRPRRGGPRGGERWQRGGRAPRGRGHAQEARERPFCAAAQARHDWKRRRIATAAAGSSGDEQKDRCEYVVPTGSPIGSAPIAGPRARHRRGRGYVGAVPPLRWSGFFSSSLVGLLESSRAPASEREGTRFGPIRSAS